MTHVPFWDQPSSQIVHSPARSESSACRREASGSHGSEMSASKRRPIVIDSAGFAERDDPLAAVAVAEQQERLAAVQRRLALLVFFRCLAAKRCVVTP